MRRSERIGGGAVPVDLSSCSALAQTFGGVVQRPTPSKKVGDRLPDEAL